ncbi:MAG: DUF58 domain-containing protein [Lachnospiraceae bacterium]
MHIVLIIVLVIVFVKGQSVVYGRLWDRKLSVKVDFSKKMAEEREDFYVVETVENRKKIPLPALSVKFSTSPNLVVSGLVKDDNASVSDKFYYSDIVPAMGQKQIVRKIPCHAGKRGIYNIDSVYLSVNNLLLSSDMHDFIDNSASIKIYPKHYNYPSIDTAFYSLMGDIVTKLNLVEDPFEFRGMRDYDTSDSMNRINWKASARTDDYVVNQFNQTITGSVVLAVNFSQATGRFEDILLEESLRLLVSIAEELLKSGFSVQFISNAKSFLSDNETLGEMGNGYRQMEIIHETTASIDADCVVKAYDQTEVSEKTFGTEDYLIFISFNQDEKLVNLFEERLEKGFPSYWLVPTNYYIDYRLPESLKNFSGEWRVDGNR